MSYPCSLCGGCIQGGGRVGINPERDFFIINLLVRIHLIVEMIWWTGLAPWEFEFPFPGINTRLSFSETPITSGTTLRSAEAYGLPKPRTLNQKSGTSILNPEP